MKKKIIFTNITLGFVLAPIMSILSISAKSDDSTSLEKIPKIGEWYNAPGFTNGIPGDHGVIFETKSGDLYAMGERTPLKVLKKGTLEFKNVMGSKISNGRNGTIFEASNGDLYAMGDGTRLQVLKKGVDHFEDALGTNITDGASGAIFQTSNGDLYAMGNGTPLQVLKTGETSFINIMGANINDGYKGIIFEAKNGNLYIAGYGKNLRVLKTGEKSFIDAPNFKPATSKFSISNANRSNWTIFETSKGDLYVMSDGSKLQVLKNKETNFQLVPGTNINNGSGGVIFEARNGDLYAMGDGTQLQVLEIGKTNFQSAHGTNVHDGKGGAIFQASNGDLYAMGSSSKLEVLKNGEKSFKEVSSSNIDDGEGGSILEAKNGDLYVMGYETKLQVLKAKTNKFVDVPIEVDGGYGTIFQASNGDLYVMSVDRNFQILKNNELEFKKTYEMIDDKKISTIIVKNFLNYYSKLQYKNSLGTKWTDLPSNGKITNLASGTYNFRWIGKNGEQYIGGTTTFLSTNHQITIDDKKEITTKNLTIILATTIPIGLISLAIIIWLIKHYLYKNKKDKI